MKKRIKVDVDPSASKQLKKLDVRVRSKIFSELKKLEYQQRNIDLKKLKGENKFRLRVGVYRVILEKVKDNSFIVFIVVDIKHRKDAYKKK